MDKEPEPPPTTAESNEPALGYVLIPPAQPPGMNTGIASVVFSLAAPCSLMVTLPVALQAVFWTRSPSGPGPYDWVAPAVLWSFPALCTLVALFIGLASLGLARRRTREGHRTKAWMTAMAGLGVVALEVSIGVAWILIARRYMILF